MPTQDSGGPIVVITREEPFFVPLYLTPLAARAARRIAMVYIAPASSPHLGKRKLLALCGPVGFARMALAAVLFKCLAALGLGLPGGRNCSVASLLKRHRIPCKPLPGDHRALVRELESLRPEVLLSVANSRILPAEVLAVPRICLNVHGSLLPKYRGVLTAFWMLYNQETTAGVTIHEMVEEVDAGGIYGQREIPVAPGETIYGLYLKIAAQGGEMIADTVLGLDKVAPRPMDVPENDPLHLAPTLEQIRDFRARGKRFV